MKWAQGLILSFALVGGGPTGSLASSDASSAQGNAPPNQQAIEENGTARAPVCASLVPHINPLGHPDPEISSNWVLGPVTQRGGTVELLLFHYRREHPVENADVGPLSVYFRASIEKNNTDAAPSFRWEARWRGAGDGPADISRVTDWIADFVEGEDQTLKSLFSQAPAGAERTICYAGFPGTSLHPEEETPALVPISGAMILVLAEVLLILVLLLFLVLPLGAAYRKRSAGVWEPLGWVCVTAGALILRLFASEGTVYHENHHGFVYLESVARGDPFVFGDLHSSFLIIHHQIAGLFHLNEGGVFFCNAVCSALIAPLLGILFSTLTQSRSSGFMAAIFWALCPVAIRIGPTECVGNFSVFFLLLGVVCALTASRKSRLRQRERAALVAAGILCVALAAQSRALTLAHPLIALTLILAAAPTPTKKQLGRAFLLIGSTALLLTPWFFTLSGLWPSAADKGPVNLRCILENLRPVDALVLNPSAVSPTLLPLALIGLVTWRSTLWQRIMLTTTLVTAFSLSATVCGDLISQTRHQLLPLALLSGVAGVGANAVLKVLHGHHKTTAATVAVLLALSPLLAFHHLRRPIQAEMEYVFLHEQVLPEIRTISTTTALVTPAPSAPVIPIPRSWWQRNLPNTRVTRSAQDLSNRPGMSFLYLGLGCHWTQGEQGSEAAPDSEEPTLAPNCAKALSTGAWTTVVEMNIPQEASVGGLLKLTRNTSTIGLYRQVDTESPEN